MFRLPRKQKKEFKRLWRIRYGCPWFKYYSLQIQYNWVKVWVWKEFLSEIPMHNYKQTWNNVGLRQWKNKINI